MINETQNMSKIIMDTHMHSKASDGMWRPSEVVEQAKLRGLETIALTDHDCIFGVEEAVAKGKELGIKVIPGIEIDASYHSGEYAVKDLELLGLGIETSAMKEFTEKLSERRMGAIKNYVKKFNEYISSQDFEGKNMNMRYPLKNLRAVTAQELIDKKSKANNYINPTPFLAKHDFINYVLENFCASNENEKKALVEDRACGDAFWEDYRFLFTREGRKPSFYEAIDAVKKAGGTAVIAHPGRSKGYKNGMIKEWEMPEEQWFSENTDKLTPFKFIKDLKEHGLDGVEIYFYSGSDKPHASQESLINNFFRKMAGKLGLITTYGSDCHGPTGDGPRMGKFGSDKLYL